MQNIDNVIPLNDNKRRLYKIFRHVVCSETITIEKCDFHPLSTIMSVQSLQENRSPPTLPFIPPYQGHPYSLPHSIDSSVHPSVPSSLSFLPLSSTRSAQGRLCLSIMAAGVSVRLPVSVCVIHVCAYLCVCLSASPGGPLCPVRQSAQRHQLLQRPVRRVRREQRPGGARGVGGR